MKLGKLAPTTDHRDLRMAHYLWKPSILPRVPDEFGHETNIGVWPMFANDSVGDCVFAGGAHEHMLWTTEGFAPAGFTDQGVLEDYAAVTGYSAADPSSDRGTVVRDALKYRRNVGMIDERGQRHQLGAFASIQPGDLDAMKIGVYLFGAIGVGVEFPSSAMDQFRQGKPWDYVAGSPIEGGHYVPLVAYRGTWVCVTWGQLQRVTDRFLMRYCDEAWCLLSQEIMRSGRSPEGFDLATLQMDLQALEGDEA